MNVYIVILVVLIFNKKNTNLKDVSLVKLFEMKEIVIVFICLSHLFIPKVIVFVKHTVIIV